MRTVACLLLLTLSFGLLVAAGDGAPDGPGKKPFSVRKLFPEAVPYAKGKKLKVAAGIVKSVEFTGTRAKVRLHNKTEHRVKPDATIWLLNADGVVLSRVRISWLIDILKPDQSYDANHGYECGMPEALTFSRFADSWDDRPAWVLVAGSKAACDKLKKRTADRLKTLRGAKDSKPK
jgi:hypothetical protein